MISLKTFKKEGVGHVGCRMSLMISSFPQILVGSSTWPDSRPELATRRKAFTAALVRRVVHVVARKGMEVSPQSCVEVMSSIFKIMVERNPQR